jgi:hypothetical protein
VVAARRSAPETAISPEWIVCNARTRAVVDGVVACPRGVSSPLAYCLECRFLEDADDDRNRERGCSADLTAAPFDARLESPTHSWAELVIELL